MELSVGAAPCFLAHTTPLVGSSNALGHRHLSKEALLILRASKQLRARPTSARRAFARVPPPHSLPTRILSGAGHAVGSFFHHVFTAFSELTALASCLLLVSLAGGCLFGYQVGRYRPVRSALDLSIEDVKSKIKLQGFVVSVADGDTIRVRHRPWWSRIRPLPPMKRLRKAEETMSIRVAGIDAPEVAHGTRQGQPFGIESQKFVREMLMDKYVTIKVLDRDQYGRIVASVEHGTWPAKKNLSQELLKKGMACIYRASGAEVGYDGKQDVYEKLEAAAKKKKVGMWSQGDKMVLPGEYKKGG